MAARVAHTSIVRCGSLTADARQAQPLRVFWRGCVVLRVVHQPSNCPAKGQPLQSAFRGFSLADPKMDDGVRVDREAGSSPLTSFGVMWSLDRAPVKAGRRTTSGGPLNPLRRCSDAAAPGGREASHPAQGWLCFAHSTAHQEAI